MFDAVVLLAPGGNTVCELDHLRLSDRLADLFDHADAGPTGHNAHVLTDYFASFG